jgi:glycosyltransferase involved in cell wall biosynthesis
MSVGREDNQLKVSIVAPCYNEEEGLREFYRLMASACESSVGEEYEIILVDDGSSDNTWPIIRNLSDVYPHAVGVRLLRNHGHQLAATAGLSVAKGNRVMLIDADLQDPPELLSQMMAMMDEGADVVYGQRISREGEGTLKLVTAALFYRLLTRLTDVPIPQDTGDFRLMNRRVVDILLSMPERQRFIRGMVGWIGGKQVALPYDRKVRFAGKTKYPFTKMVLFAVDAITSFSTFPLRLAVWAGGLTAILALALTLYTLVQWASGESITGWASIMTTITLFASVQMLTLGVIGEYLGRLINDTKGRPLFMIDQVVSQRIATEKPLKAGKIAA